MIVRNPTEFIAHAEIQTIDGKIDTVHIMPKSRVTLEAGSKVTPKAMQKYPKLQVRYLADKERT